MGDFGRKILLREKQIEMLGGAERLAGHERLREVLVYPQGFGEFFYCLHTQEDEKRYQKWLNFWRPITRGKDLGQIVCYHKSATAETLQMALERLGDEAAGFLYVTLNQRLPKNLTRHLVLMNPTTESDKMRVKVFSVFKLSMEERGKLEKHLLYWKEACTQKFDITQVDYIKPYCLEFVVDSRYQTQETIHLLTFSMEDYSTNVSPLELVVIGGDWEPKMYEPFSKGDFRSKPRSWWPRLKRDYCR